MNDEPQALAGVGVVVTRPAGQAEALCRRIAAAGGEAIAFPTIAIRPPPDPAPLRAALARLEGYDYALFVSANAVRGVHAGLGGRPWPDGVGVIAIGQRTAAAIRELGWPVTLSPPAPYTSETLLAMPELQRLGDCSIVIFRGTDGRSLLRDALTERGARVEHIAAYARVPAQVDPAPVRARWAAGGIDVVLVTSNEILENLFHLLGGDAAALVRDTPLIVPGERVQRRAVELGCRKVIPAAHATDEAMFAALAHWAGERDANHQTTNK